MSLSIQPNFDLKSEKEVKEKKDKQHDSLKSDILGSSHSVAEVVHQEIQDVKERKQKAKKEEKEVEKKQSDKSTSVALATDELKAKDLLDDFAQRMVKKEQNKLQEQMEKKLKQQYSEQINDIVRDQTQSKFKDTVQISRFAAQQVEDNFKKEKKTEENSSHHAEQVTQNGRQQTAGAFASQAAADTTKNIKLRQEKHQETIQENPRRLEQGMKDYVSAYAESLISKEPKKKQEATRLRDNLQSMGLSTKKLVTMESQAQKMVAGDIKRMMKQSFLKVGFTYDSKKMSAELLANYQNYKEMSATAEKLGVFGAGTKEETQFREEVKSEVRDFIKMELDRSMIEAKLKSNDVKELVKAFDKLNNVAGFANFEPGSYMRFFNKKLNDLGLVPFMNPNPPSGQMDTDTSGQGSRQEQKDGEVGIEAMSLEDKLKSLHIKKYTLSGPFEIVKHALEIRKIEGQLKDQGKAAMVEKIQKEAPSLAKLKLSFMLRETFEARASLFELSGPKYNLVTKRLKSILKGFKQLGDEMPKSALKDIMDQSNKAIFSVVKEDYIKLKVHYEINPKNVALKQRHDAMIKLLARLREESSISEELEPKLMRQMDFLSDVNIIEAA